MKEKYYWYLKESQYFRESSKLEVLIFQFPSPGLQFWRCLRLTPNFSVGAILLQSEIVLER
jgi:hypothetical protein